MAFSTPPLRLTPASIQPIRLLLLPLLTLSIVTACVPAGGPRAAPEPERVGPPAGVLGEELRPVHDRLLGAVDYDLPVVANTWVESELNFLVGQRRDVVLRWMERGDFYQEFIQSVFREYGIPTDLYHLGMIESGFIPTARSRAGAVGMWQFMPATSRDVNLRVDAMVDERMDPVRSTRAAARHLRHLYRVHGDWELAAAAYNAGSSRISRGLERYSATNFWDLAQRGDLAAETRQYVPRLFAMTIIARDRQRFGFSPPARNGTFAFDSVQVRYSTPLVELASSAGVPVETLRQMNPHLLSGVTPADSYWVWVPPGSASSLRLAGEAASPRPEAGFGEYTVRWGDTLGRIAQLSGVGSARILDLNPSVDFDRLQAGAVIRLPAAAAEQLAARPETPIAPAAQAPAPEPSAPPPASEAQRAAAALLREAAATPDPAPAPAPARPAAASPPPAATAAPAGARAAAVHEVQPGETLSHIARTYGVSVTAIREANGLRGDVIRSGQRLSVPVSIASGPPPVEHVVAAGETLSGIAGRYGASVATIRDANALTGDVIRPGQRLTVPATGATTVTSVEDVVAAGGTTVAPVEHVVAAGETLSGIASRYGGSVAAIREANGLTGDVIRPGQRLTIPAAGGATVTAVEHVVAAGETLSGIASRYGGSVAAIREANGLAGDVIRPGQRLTIPATGATTVTTVEHVVAAGETLTGIARRYGASVSGIREANGLSGDVIRPGQRLTVPL